MSVPPEVDVFNRQFSLTIGLCSISMLLGTLSFGATSSSGAPKLSASLPNGAVSATLAPGATQPNLIFAPTSQSTASADRTSAPAAAATPSGLAAMIRRRAIMQTPGGHIATAPLNGLPDGTYVIVHSDGTVGVN